MPIGEHDIANGASPAEGWVSTIDMAGLAAWLRSRRRVVVLTHVKPDGDALGSTLAIARALALNGAEATTWYAGPLPDWFEDLVGDTPWRHVETHGAAGLPEPDGILIADTGSWSQLQEVRPWLEPRRERAAILDHHLQGDPDVAPRRLIVTTAAAAAEPAMELCRLILGLARPEDLPRAVAEPLYLGLASDTGWFRHSNTSPSALRAAAALLDAGADHARLYELTEQRDSVARLRLTARALDSLELIGDGRAAVMTLTLDDFKACGASPSDSGGFSDMALNIAGVQVAATITEAPVHEGQPPMTKVSLRSKSGPGAPNVNDIARRLGGGGHARAAGAKLRLPLAEARRQVVGALLS